MQSPPIKVKAMLGQKTNTGLNQEDMARIDFCPLDATHAPFIIELVNSPGWLEFIGERNVRSQEDARKYIIKIENNPDVKYWVIQLKNTKEAIGIVTLIHRDYLDAPDIGFALLPAFEKQGYAFEAVSIFLGEFAKDPGHEKILAITLPHNQKSVQLLERLGLKYCKEINTEGKPLSLYSKKLR
jgi:[ribosomal protein S5]-alanine N-acetyltransferase